MLTKENGLRYAKLIHVSIDNGKTDNSNKVYIMEELSDGRIKCEYGRVGKTLTTEYKPSSKWSSVYKQKISKTKGYTDVTDLISQPLNQEKGDTKIEAIKDDIVRKLFEDLMSYANKTIQKNYKVTQESVTEQQIIAAQDILNQISGLIKIGVDVKELNNSLIKLYTIIPRKMDNVKNFLFEEINNNDELKNAQQLLDNEQSLLDTMSGQVQLFKAQRQDLNKNSETPNESSVTILDQMGIQVEVEKDEDTLLLINKLLGSNNSKAKGIFKVINHKTKLEFNNTLNKKEVKKKRLYWHGSRNENIINILQTGLLIRPSGAVHTGSMFGDGIYGASVAQKSIGYTSLRGSYWAHGDNNKAYLMLFHFHLGKQKHIYKHDSSCYNLSKKLLDKEGFDSVYAHGGADLRNDEFIIYDPAQCTISHLIEIGH